VETQTKPAVSPFWWMAGGMLVGAVVGIFLGASWAIAGIAIGAAAGYFAEGRGRGGRGAWGSRPDAGDRFALTPRFAARRVFLSLVVGIVALRRQSNEKRVLCALWYPEF
jgi:hypothetical protein